MPAVLNLPPGSRVLYRVLSEKSRIDFGKHAGLLVGDILAVDETYIPFLYYNFSNLSFRKDILEALEVTPIPKPGTNPEMWKQWKSKHYFEEIEGLSEQEKIIRKKRLARIRRGRDLEKAISRRNAESLSPGQLQAINHGHIPTGGYVKFIRPEKSEKQNKKQNTCD